MVYGRRTAGGRWTVLQYWLFYGFDLYSPTDPPGDLWQAHEADWEAVAVALEDGVPRWVGVSRHCTGIRRAWTRVPRRGAHPVVFAALGSHAGAFAPGAPAVERRCWPPGAAALADGYGIAIRDHVERGRTLAPAVVPVTASVPGWLRFAGAWGEAQYVHAPGRAPYAYGTSPRGPAFHALWQRPLATVLGWPAG